MNLNNKGFTLTELIAVIVILAILALVGIPAYNTISRQTMERQYENLVSLIETEATKYGAATGSNLTNVDELIKEGYLEADGDDDEGNPTIFDPRDNSSMNCLLVEIEYQNGSYKSKFTGEKYCELENAKIEKGTIKIVAEGYAATNTIYDFSEWLNESVLLYVDTTNLSKKEIVKEYKWTVGSAGVTRNQQYLKIGIFSYVEDVIDISETGYINSTISVEVTCESGNTYSAMLEGENSLKIDISKPKINEEVIISGEYNKTITVKANDYGSGIYGYYIGPAHCSEKSSFVKSNSNEYVFQINHSNIADSEYYICVKDYVGNITEYPESVYLK